MRILFVVLSVIVGVAVAQCPGTCGKAAAEPQKSATTYPSAAAGTCPSAAAGGCGRQAIETEHCHWLEVDAIVPNSPAEAAGVQVGDALYSYCGQTVGCMADFNAAKAAATGDTVAAVFRRGEQELPVSVVRGQQMGVYLHEWLNDVVPDSDAKLIPDVPRLAWSTGKTSSFMAALEAALYPLGDRSGYAFLSGVSGAAFSTHFFDDWCPSSPYPGCGYNTAAAAIESRGFKTRDWQLSPDGKNRLQILKAIKASIDVGIPVLAWGIGEGAMEFEHSVIAGYQKNGEELLVRSYGDKRKGYDIARNFPKAATVLKRDGKVPAELASCRKGFSIVVENQTTEKYGQYYSGLAAFDKWLERLKTMDLAGFDSTGFSNVIQANYWIFSRLVSDRRTGLDYLGALTDQYLPEQAQTLGELARLYAEEVDILGPLESRLPCPGTVTRPEQWTRERRDPQIMALARARAIEEATLPLWRRLAAAK
jgi:hypothetical protein